MSDALGRWLCLAVAYGLPPITIAIMAWWMWWSTRDDRRAAAEVRAWGEARGLSVSGSLLTYPAEARGTIEGVTLHLRLSGGPGVGRTTLRARISEKRPAPPLQLMNRTGLLSLGDDGYKPARTGHRAFDSLFWFRGRAPSKALSPSALAALVALHGRLHPFMRDKVEVDGRTPNGELVLTMWGRETKAETLDAAVTFALRVFGIESPSYR